MHNDFALSLAEERPLIGLFSGLVETVAAEIVATAGFDWVLLDCEHATNSPRTVLHQLQALAAHPIAPVVRPVSQDPALIKQYLDVGAKTLLVPMVDTPEQAADVVAATRYPPAGIRGVGASLARAAQWGRVPEYLTRADEHMFVIAQIESQTALANIEEIAAVDGIYGLFVGPSDLAASLGHLGHPGDAAVKTAALDAIKRITACGLPAGVYASSSELAESYLEAGARFLAVGSDIGALVRATADIRAAFP